MADDASDRETPTRRDYLKYGGTIVAGGLIAGCSGQSDSESTPDDTAAGDSGTTTGETTAGDPDSTTNTAGDGEASTTTETATETPEDESYTVTVEPTGAITFEAPPERALAYSSNYGDMLVALGQGDSFVATTDDSYPSYPYEDLDVDFSPDQLEVALADGALSKELLYDLDPDVIHVDPTVAVQWFGFDQSDVEEISENVAPWAANYIRRRGDDWHDYPYYTLYEAFEKVAEIYRERERYEAFRQLHDEVIGDVRSRLPPEGERPTVGLLTLGSDTESGDLVGLPIQDELGRKHYFDLGVRDALSDLDVEGAFYNFDYEGLLEVDPETIVVPWGRLQSEAEFRETFVQPMREDPVASQVAAVENDRVFRGGTANQGPIVNLVNTEYAAQRFYPEEFGDERLFDRQRVADIVAGDLRT